MSVSREVLTAVEFLSDVFEKGVHKEEDLRKYLFHKRHLRIEQIDLAFKIYYSGIQNRKGEGHAERPEVTAPRMTSGDYIFLLPIYRARAVKYINDFLRSEYKYCNVLECLTEEYYKYLLEMAHRQKISISRKELAQIFQRILQLCKFHKNFYVDLKQRTDKFGQLFVKNFDVFRDYAEYIKECSRTIKTIREYIFDKKLRASLDHVRATCRRPDDDMMDLIISPMFRLKEYKTFIDKLYGWADETQETDYLFLGRASRRIGRVVDWIEKHKHSIINKNEMNKVQWFLDDQCNILSPNRRIVRRGMIIRRTTSWPVRNKNYIFFLFNDILLWTTKKGELQNVMRLRNCVVRSSESKYNQALKFEVEANMKGEKDHKLLKLECKDPKQRNEWYEAIKNGVEAVKNATVKEGDRREYGEEDLMRFIEKNSEIPSSPVTNSAKSFERKDDDDSDTVVPESGDEEDSQRPTHRRLDSSRNFVALEFNDSFLPLDEMSETSEEPDKLMDTQDEYGESMGVLFPNKGGLPPRVRQNLNMKITPGQKKIPPGCVSHKNLGNLTEMRNFSRSKGVLSSQLQSTSVKIGKDRIKNEIPEQSYSSNSKRKYANVIRRQGKYVNNLERYSSYTIHLSNFNQ